MPERWSVTIDENGTPWVSRFSPAPRFTAMWTTDAESLADIEGPCWSDPGSGEGPDTIHLCNFIWIDPPPDQTAFEAIMSRAAQVIDDWIAERI